MKVHRPNALVRCVDPRFKTSIAILIALSALIAIPLFSSSLASSSDQNLSRGAAKSAVKSPPARLLSPKAVADSVIKNKLADSSLFPLLMPQAGSDSVDMFAADCTTPQSTFEVGETACAKASGPLVGARFIYWVNSQGVSVQSDMVTPSSPSATRIVNEKGNWSAYLSDYEARRDLESFQVSDPAVPAVDLAVVNNINAGSVFAGNGFINYEVTATNRGPNAATTVQLVQSIPNNAAFVSASQESGPAFTCTENAADTTCTISSLGSGASSTFTFIYQVMSGTPAATVVTNTANLSSATVELHEPDNSAATEGVVVAGAAPSSCQLDCPEDMTVLANATHEGNSGAFVTFSTAEGFGDCGSISSSIPSGSFFPVGPATQVVVTSETGGGSCTFNVTVVTEGAPTISCPEDQSVTAATGETEATVTPGTPTTNPSSGVTVSGVRSDNRPLSDQYPVGLTVITWTVTDSVGLSSSCTQNINVNSDACGDDTTPPTVVAPADVTSQTPSGTVGSCGVVIGESQLGNPDVQDNCNVNVVRTGVPAGNFFPVGSTTITYTATDGAGLTATDTQVIVVEDATAPIIAAPADASYVCPSEVPAADPSQATRGEVLDENGNPLPPGPPIDNCGTPTVTVADSSTGAGSASDPMIITRTFTATDAAGNVANAVQTITVSDGIVPTITAPAAASYQCASEVPAADPAAASADDNCADPTVTVSDASNGGAGTTASPLVITRTFTATDAAGNTASDSQTITVIDSTNPTLTAAAPATASADASCQAAIPDFAATSTASDNCGTVTKTQSPAAGTAVTLGTHTVTITATDAAGNSTSADTTFTVADTTAPVISCPSNIVVSLPLNSSDTSMAVNFAAPTATDNCTASPGVVTSLPSGHVFPVGTTIVTATATDAAGNSSSCSFTVTVLYNFAGFFSPVDNLPMLNVVNAGRGIPVKFSLSGNKGLDIFAANSPYTIGINCDGSAPQSDIEETVTAGSSSLSYNAGSDQYNYIWKTENSWAGTCRQLVVTLNDGSEHRANFKFK